MIITDVNKFNNYIIKTNTFNNDGQYYIILQHNQTLKWFGFYVDDVSNDCKYYKFEFDYTDDMPHGEYTWFICKYLPYSVFHIDTQDVFRSCHFDLSELNLIVNYGDPLTNYGAYIVNGSRQDIDDLECIKIPILQYGLLQRFNFDEYREYRTQPTFNVYEYGKQKV